MNEQNGFLTGELCRALRACLLAVVLAGAVDPTPALAVGHGDWRRLLDERYLGPFPVPEESVILDVDAARFRLRGGSLWLQTPLSSGAVVGLAFEGDGVLEMDVPDAVELTQLRRYLANEEIEGVESSFGRLVLQTSWIDVVELLGSLLDSSPSDPDAARRLGWASERHERWREVYGRDPAARTIASLRNLGGRYFHAELDTTEHGWLAIEFDDHRREELVLQSFETRGSFLTLFNKLPYPVLETWLSLDREEDRDASGRPALRPNHGSRLLHFEAEVDLVRPGTRPRFGIGNSHSVNARMILDARFRSLRDGLGSLRLQLDPMSVIDSVRDEDGRELEHLRYDTGEHDLSRDDRLHDRELVVLLERPMFAGEERRIVIETELELIDHAGGLHWYPIPVETEYETHTAKLRFRHRRDTGVVTLGNRLGRQRLADGKFSTAFEIAEPTSMIGFSFAQKPHSVTVTTEDGLPITFFGTTNGFMSKRRVGKLSDEVVATLDYLEELFGYPIASDQLVVSLTESDAQTFPGLIQLWNGFVIDGGELGSNDHGYREHFLAHELAHLWLGHQVGWASYRDYWLIESLAEYAAFLYVESQLERGDRVAERILEAYTDSVTGSLKSRFDSFASWGLAFGGMSGARRSAPLSHGGRARISEMPAGAYSNLYRKGMLVLHMIRLQARARTGDDDAFLEILRQYATRFRGQKPATDDFRRLVEERLTGDWKRFFAQWVDGAEIPTLRWQPVASRPHGDGFLLGLEVRREDVAPDFLVEIPLLIEHADGTLERRLLEVADDNNRIEIALEARPHRIEFNEEHGVLSRMRRRDRGWKRGPADSVSP